MIGALLLAAAMHCTPLPPDAEVCRSYETLRIARGAKVLFEKPAESMFVDGTKARRVDLDADGEPEIVVADLAAVSNGMAVSTWTLVVLDGRTGAASALEAEDFGEGSLRRERDGRYTVLRTSWEWIGDHLYFVARPYAYRGGKLVPQKERGMWQRPYRFRFERERNEGCTCPGRWLRKATRVAWTD